VRFNDKKKRLRTKKLDFIRDKEGRNSMNKIAEYFKGKKSFSKIAFLITLVFLVSYYIAFPGVRSLYKEELTIRVDDKFWDREGLLPGSGKYIIVAREESGKSVFFEVTNNIFLGKFDAGARYAALEVGKTYDVVVVGLSSSSLSYKNIVEIAPAK
jgi:hypothetical protein